MVKIFKTVEIYTTNGAHFYHENVEMKLDSFGVRISDSNEIILYPLNSVSRLKYNLDENETSGE